VDFFHEEHSSNLSRYVIGGGKFAAGWALRPVEQVSGLILTTLQSCFFLRFAAISSICLTLLIASATGCHSDSPPTQAVTAPPPARPQVPASPLEQRVMARHDSLMRQTGELFTLRRRLSGIRPTLLNRTAQLARLDDATAATQLADNAMTDWMHGYRRPASTTAPDSAARYYEQQLRILDQVADLTHRAHDSATAVVQAFSPALPPTR
jgi:hypothetical protein